MTKIEWADKTWNPVTGCTKISEGCKNCYAERMSHRLKGRFGYPEDEPFAVTVHEDKLEQPLRWKQPRTIFVCSMGDLFHEQVSFMYLHSIFSVMACCPQHTFIVLTKRPREMYEWFIHPHIHESLYPPEGSIRGEQYGSHSLPLTNVWGLVTVENQEQADLRIPLLLQCQFVVRGVSIEPMLGAVDLSYWLDYDASVGTRPGLDWIICGGETGPGARPMDPNWARDVRDQCKEASVPFFFKKMGRGQPTPDDLMIREWPTQS